MMVTEMTATESPARPPCEHLAMPKNQNQLFDLPDILPVPPSALALGLQSGRLVWRRSLRSRSSAGRHGEGSAKGDRGADPLQTMDAWSSAIEHRASGDSPMEDPYYDAYDGAAGAGDN